MNFNIFSHFYTKWWFNPFCLYCVDCASIPRLAHSRVKTPRALELLIQNSIGPWNYETAFKLFKIVKLKNRRDMKT